MSLDRFLRIPPRRPVTIRLAPPEKRKKPVCLMLRQISREWQRTCVCVCPRRDNFLQPGMGVF